MDELGWLWKELPVFMPDLYPEFYSGDAASKPADLETCTSQNASRTLVRLTPIALKTRGGVSKFA